MRIPSSVYRVLLLTEDDAPVRVLDDHGRNRQLRRGDVVRGHKQAWAVREAKLRPFKHCLYPEHVGMQVDEGRDFGWNLIADPCVFDPETRFLVKRELEKLPERLEAMFKDLTKVPCVKRLSFFYYLGLDRRLERRTLEETGKIVGFTKEQMRHNIDACLRVLHHPAHPSLNNLPEPSRLQKFAEGLIEILGEDVVNWERITGIVELAKIPAPRSPGQSADRGFGIPAQSTTEAVQAPEPRVRRKFTSNELEGIWRMWRGKVEELASGPIGQALLTYDLRPLGLGTKWFRWVKAEFTKRCAGHEDVLWYYCTGWDYLREHGLPNHVTPDLIRRIVRESWWTGPDHPFSSKEEKRKKKIPVRRKRARS